MAGFARQSPLAPLFSSRRLGPLVSITLAAASALLVGESGESFSSPVASTALDGGLDPARTLLVTLCEEQSPFDPTGWSTLAPVRLDDLGAARKQPWTLARWSRDAGLAADVVLASPLACSALQVARLAPWVRAIARVASPRARWWVLAPTEVAAELDALNSVLEAWLGPGTATRLQPSAPWGQSLPARALRRVAIVSPRAPPERGGAVQRFGSGIDGFLFNASSTFGAVSSFGPAGGCPLDWVVLVLGPNNEGSIFGPVAQAVVEGLRELGLSAEVVRCPLLEVGCDPRQWDGRQLVVLGANTLARTRAEKADGSNELAVLIPHLNLLPPSAILYQFEHVTESLGSTQWMTHDYIRVLRAFTVWEYSGANLFKLGLHGVRAQLVPVGYTQAWDPPTVPQGPSGAAAIHTPPTDSQPQEGLRTVTPTEVDPRAEQWFVVPPTPALGRNELMSARTERDASLSGDHWLADGATSRGPVEEDIDVLFFGSMTAYRRPIIEALQRMGGLRMAVMNRVWGEDLWTYIRRARVVLSLRTWGDDGESKMVRLAPLLAGGRFVLSEEPGGMMWEEALFWREEGIAYAPKENLLAAVRHFLAHPDERAAIAERGRQLFRERTMASGLELALHNLWVLRGCRSVPAEFEEAAES